MSSIEKTFQEYEEDLDKIITAHSNRKNFI